VTVQKKGRDEKDEARAERCPERNREAIERMASNVKESDEICDREELGWQELDDVKEAQIQYNLFANELEERILAHQLQIRAHSNFRKRRNTHRRQLQARNHENCHAAKETSLPMSSPTRSSDVVRSTTFEHETSLPDETIKHM
jgi:hypothetical protein